MWGLWAPIGDGVELSGPLPGHQQTVPRAELWAALQAVRHAIGPVLLLIDNELVCMGVARLGADPLRFQVDLRSEMADLWRDLQQLLLERPASFCSAIWVPSHGLEAASDPDAEEKRLAKLRRARAQQGWQEEWLLHNDRADKAAGRARQRHPVPTAAVDRVKRVGKLAKRTLRAAVEAVEAAGRCHPGRQRAS